MRGVDPHLYMTQLAGRLDRLRERDEIETALDELEYLFEVIDPELQDAAYQLIDRLRTKLTEVSG